MDTYFTHGFEDDISLWYNNNDEPFLPAPVLVQKPSAFESFRDTTTTLISGDTSSSSSSKSNNVNKRVIEFLRRSAAKNAELVRRKINEDEHERERSFRHMMNERMRRSKQKENYFALHSLLPLGTKDDKLTIVQTAARKIQHMVSYRERLMKRRTELEAALAAQKKSYVENENVMRAANWRKVKVKVGNPTSGIDSMMEVLNFLKRFGLKAINIQSVFTEVEFLAELEIETMVEPAEIEEAIQITLYEAELRLRSHF